MFGEEQNVLICIKTVLPPPPPFHDYCQRVNKDIYKNILFDDCYIYRHCAKTLFNLRKRVVLLLLYKVIELLIFIFYGTCLVNTYVYCFLLD